MPTDKKASTSEPSSTESSFHFPPDFRVKKRSEFVRVQEAGKKIPFSFKPSKDNPDAAIKKSTDCFLLISAPIDKRFKVVDSTRIGITITKKVHKRAVRRNRVKRRIREVFRHERPKFRKNRDIVIICRKGAEELSFEALEKDILQLFKRVGLYAS